MAAIKDIKIEHPDSKLSFEFKVATPGQYVLQLCDDITCKIEGIDFGIASEEHAQIKKIRVHQYMDIDGFWVNYQAVLPFGSEPKIGRKLEFYNNHCKIATNLSLNTGFPFSYFNMDTIRLQADWKKIGLVTASESGELELNWNDLKDFDSGIIYNSPTSFISCILQTNDGKLLEIGSGDDLWRWNIAEQLTDTTSEFRIELKDNELVLTRKPVIWQEEIELKRDWRFKWYIAWQVPTEKSIDIGSAEMLPQNIDSFKYTGSNHYKLPDSWPQNALVTNSSTSSPCLHASIVKRYLKTFIRSIKNQLEQQTIYISGIEPHLCSNASHLERPKRKTLLHWDLLDILEFQFWADKQLKESQSKLIIIPDKKSALANLPSLNFSN
jgi:hypothetical protein